MEATWWTRPEQLDAKQKDVLALDKDSSHLVCGPPGSGKTNLLLLRAAYLHRINRRNFHVLTYGRVLREFLVTGAEHYPFSHDRVRTFVSWAMALSKDHGLEVLNTRDQKALRRVLLSNLQAIGKRPGFHKYDCLLVDEVQDYLPVELDAMLELADRVFLVGDERQEIYGANDGLSHAVTRVPSVLHLSAHYRNGLKICRVADDIMGELDSSNGLEATSNYDEVAFPSSVLDFADLDLEQQANQAISEIENQLIAYANGFIGVLCPRHVDLDTVAAVFRGSRLAAHVQVQKYVEGYSSLSPDKRILLTTMHGAKGLEFRAVHMLAADEIGCFRQQTRKVAYTAVTRAKTYLAAYHNDALPGFLDNAFACAEVIPPPEPSLEDLFR